MAGDNRVRNDGEMYYGVLVRPHEQQQQREVMADEVIMDDAPDAALFGDPDGGEPELPEKEYVGFPEDDAREHQERHEEEADAQEHGHQGGGECALCHFGDDMGAQANGGPHAEILRFQARNFGRIDEGVIFRSMLQARREQVEAPLASQGEPCRPWSLAGVRQHFREHAVNPMRYLAGDIEFCEMTQKHFRRQGILQKDTRSGAMTIDHKGLDSWIKLSRQKAALCKEYVNARAAEPADGGLPEVMGSKKRKGADGLSVLSTNATKESTHGVNFFSFSAQ